MRAIQMLLAAIPLIACSVGTHPAPGRVVEPRASTGSAAHGPSPLRQAMEEGHRAARAEKGLPPLSWDLALARDAQAYADTLAATGNFEHSEQPDGDAVEGENLWSGTRGAYRYAEMVGHWVEEKRDYVPGILPDVSRTGQFEDVGHYTQIMWRATRRFGCAQASSAEDDYVVCRYAPAGNYIGQRAF